MKEIARRALLYDFYGELLTDHQKKVYEDAVMNDFSLSELAEEYGVSRQGVHDLVKRVDRQLKEYEQKLGLVDRFLKIRSEVNGIRAMAECGKLSDEESGNIIRICDRILTEL